MKISSIFLTWFCGLCSIAAASTSPTDYLKFNNNGVEIAYRVFGTSGTPLIILNGGPGRSSDSFEELALKLQSVTGRQIVIFDQRGTGRSKLAVLDKSTITLDLMISDLEALRKHLGLNRLSILGHSFGGMYAMAYAATYPANIEALILSCSGGLDLTWGEYVNHNMLSRLTMKERAKHGFWTHPDQVKKDPTRATLEALKILIPAYVYDRKAVPKLRRSLLDLNQYTPEINGLVWASMQNFDLKLALKALAAPTLIIAGRQDILGEAVPLKIQHAISNSTLEFLDECSHYPWLDQPNRYFELIKEFLK